MRWIFLLAVICGILSAGFWIVHQMDQTILITDYWKSTGKSEWGLVDFRGKDPELYTFESYSGLWPIFKGLWPVWTLFFLLFLVLIPLSFLIYNGLNNMQIASAKNDVALIEIEMEEAEKRANKRIMEAEKKVNSAYEEQRKRAHAELESETQNLHHLKNELLQRETAIKKREIAAQKAQERAAQDVSEVQRLYADELQRFETEITGMARARDNAQAGYQRLKNKKKC